MLIKTKGMRNVSKEKIKMKGLCTPQLFIWAIGMLHNHRRLITGGEEGYNSPYINKKVKDFHEYAAKMYQCTSVLLSQHILAKEQALNELQMIEEELENYLEIKHSDSDMSIAEHRRINSLEKKKEKLEAKRKECLRRAKEEEKAIGASETETEEMILGTRCKIEGLLFTYLSGAHKSVKQTALNIPFPHDAFQIYRTYVPEPRAHICTRENAAVTEHPDI